MASAFEYSPLDPSDPRAFRILHLLPSLKDKDPIRCELQNRSLGQDIQYEALSYAWGQDAPSCPIIINGQSGVNVTESCVEALRSLRQRFHRRVLWVDAICINQLDDDTSKREKNHQVRFMYEIYKEAECVLIWLGPSEPGTKRTIRMLKLLRIFDAKEDYETKDGSSSSMKASLVSRLKYDVAKQLYNRMCAYTIFLTTFSINC
jgi:hypothetical protein